MSTFDNPFDSARRLHGCRCGQHGSEAEHEAWFAEFLGNGPSGHYSREGRPNSPYVGKFLTAGQG